jgi:hypothetical protein
MRRSLIAVSGIALATIALAACSSSSSSSSSSAAASTAAATDAAASPSGSMVGGMTECTKAAVQPAVDQAAKAMGADNVMTIDDLQCADGWAVASGILGTAAQASATDGPQGAPTIFIFEAEGQFWVPKAAADVCGTTPTDGSTAAPADAMIPPALYAACLAS